MNTPTFLKEIKFSILLMFILPACIWYFQDNQYLIKHFNLKGEFLKDIYNTILTFYFTFISFFFWVFWVLVSMQENLKRIQENNPTILGTVFFKFKLIWITLALSVLTLLMMMIYVSFFLKLDELSIYTLSAIGGSFFFVILLLEITHYVSWIFSTLVKGVIKNTDERIVCPYSKTEIKS